MITILLMIKNCTHRNFMQYLHRLQINTCDTDFRFNFSWLRFLAECAPGTTKILCLLYKSYIMYCAVQHATINSERTSNMLMNVTLIFLGN